MALFGTLMPGPTVLCLGWSMCRSGGVSDSVVHGLVALFGVSAAKRWRGDPSFLFSRLENSMTN